jgi:hypothetical protein
MGRKASRHALSIGRAGHADENVPATGKLEALGTTSGGGEP